MSSLGLEEIASNLILSTIKANIAQALADVRTDYADPTVTIPVPATNSYFIYPYPMGYRPPFIQLIASAYRKMGNRGANHVNGQIDFDLSVIVEDTRGDNCMKQTYRYRAALQKILDQTNLTNVTPSVKLVVLVNTADFSELYLVKPVDGESVKAFRREVNLKLLVEVYENF